MTEFNMKPRLLYCPQCKTDTENAKPFPKCDVCGSNLITVLFSPLDGSRITPLPVNPIPTVVMPDKR